MDLRSHTPVIKAQKHPGIQATRETAFLHTSAMASRQTTALLLLAIIALACKRHSLNNGLRTTPGGEDGLIVLFGFT